MLRKVMPDLKKKKMRRNPIKALKLLEDNKGLTMKR